MKSQNIISLCINFPKRHKIIKMFLGEYNGNRYELLDKGTKKASDINH